MDEATAALAAPLRKRLERILGKTVRSRDKLARQRDEENPATSEFETLKEIQSALELQRQDHEKISQELYETETNPTAIEDDEQKSDEFDRAMTLAAKDCRYLLSQRAIYSTISSLEASIRGVTAAYEATPENDHSAAISRVNSKIKELENDLHLSLMTEEEGLRGRGNLMLERAYATQGRVAGAKATDVKPAVTGSSKSNVKLKYIDIPSFSGKTEDWMPFKRLFFKAVHENESLDDDTRLTYLVQAMLDPRVKSEYSERLDEPGAYKKILKELEEEHDKPRWMHRRYCESMKNLSTNPHTREGMKALISQINVILNGFIRLKGEDCRYILTSMTEAVLDPQLRALWNQRTDSRKTTPPIEDLLQFIKDQSDQIEDESVSTASRPTYDKKARGHQTPKFRGSTHSVVSPVPVVKGSQQKQVYQSSPRTPFTSSTATCTLCQGGNNLFYCPTFEGYTVQQRKDHVMNFKLCLNCLKANHVAHDCRSTYRCKAKDCGRRHNTLLHDDKPAAPTQQPASHQATAAVHSEDEEEKSCLLMTVMVNLTGPTGKVITVRAMLDSGSTLSIISTRLMKFLSLERTGKTVAISGIKSKSSQQGHPLSQLTISSDYKKGWSRNIRVAGLDEVIRQLPLQSATSVRKLEHIKNLVLADDQFDQPGKIEVLLGQNVWRHVVLEGKIKGSRDSHPEAWQTVFGWTVLGNYTPGNQRNSQQVITHTIASTEDKQVSDTLLTRFWRIEEPSVYETALSPEEIKIENHYQQTHTYDAKKKRYTVRLPMSDERSELGESRTQALNRAKANEQSLIKKGKLAQFQEVLQEYVDLGHAVPVGKDQHPAQVYFMPIHAVFKDSSTTTKLRAVFDASAKTTNKKSLNDLLAVGPTLHPTIDQILLRFRGYAIALSSDISKMYREVLLHPEDRPLHQFIWRSNQAEDWQEYQMSRVTFGVTVSPYLAVKTLQQAAEDFGEDCPEAQWHLKNSFYVDDLMGGAATPKEALHLYEKLLDILSQASFHLRKWRSNSTDVLKKIPKELQEILPTQDLVDLQSASYPKALGVAWDSRADTMFTHINLPTSYASTKRGIVSDIARTFDVLGWLSPAILPMKLLYRDLWKEKLDWDSEVQEEHKHRHRIWRDELPILSEVRLPRHYFRHQQPVSVELHGFADASNEAYAAVIYVRATYPSGSPSSEIVISKSKVTPPESRTIPQLELCCANLLAKLMTTTRQNLDVPLERVYAYSDSTIVLAWLDGQSKRYCIFSANRIASTVALVPTTCWRHVPTHQNPADVASRGISATELRNHHLWWHGPPWLTTQPVVFPIQPSEALLQKLQEVEAKPEKATVLAVVAEDCIEDKFESYRKLLRVFCWIRRWMCFSDCNRRKSEDLTVAESQEATQFLISRSQHRSFSEEIKMLTKDPPQELSRRSKILVLRPRVDTKLLKIGGRFNQTNYPSHQKNPIILSAKDCLTKLLFRHYHQQLGHCGPSTLLTHAANIYHVVGGRTLARSICTKCVVCRKASAKASSQLLGQLPPARVEPNYIFLHTGMDFAGPFIIKRGHTRRPVKIEAHLAIFVCFITRAVHLELVSDQTTQAFLAALDRFIDRRGLPLHLYSNNGANYTGAKNQLSQFYEFVNSKECQNAVQSYSFDYEITWHNSPQRAPHFGGLWEAAVKSSKYHLKRIVGQKLLTFEELSTICCNVESFLNSRPLGPVTSHDIDGLCPLTPSHFLIGRAARAYPKTRITHTPTTLQRWEICKKASQDFWDRWSQEYLQQLQKATKWHKHTRNYEIGDLVMLTDGNAFQCQWTMAKVINVYPGKDGLVRAVDVQIERKVIPANCNSKELLARDITTKTSIFRRPVTRLALLLAVDEFPGEKMDLDKPGFLPDQTRED